MNLCLTPEELHSLTGYRRANDQCRFLDTAGVLYRLNKCGKPVVARTNAERYLGVSGAAQVPAANEPDWSLMAKIRKSKAA